MKVSSVGSEHPDEIGRVGGSNPFPKTEQAIAKKKHFIEVLFLFK